MQLDIFDHSRDVMLRNDVVHALEARDAARARAAWQALLAEYPQDALAPDLQTLAEALATLDPAPFHGHADMLRASQAQQDQLRPAALRVLGEGTAAWLRPFWANLAARAARLPYRADGAADGADGASHAAALWLQAQDWKAARDAVAAIASWRRIPQPLAWMAEARLHLFGLQPTWGLLAELAWLAPGLFGEVARRVADPVLLNLLARFEAGFEGAGDASDLAWFPAWVLTERPALAETLQAAEPAQHSAPEQAMRLLVELLRLERQGRHREIVARRQALRDLQPGIYSAYIKTR